MKFKKQIAALTAITIASVSSVNVFAAENLYLSTGEISYSGKINTARQGDAVSVMVVKDAEKWTDKEQWKNGSGDNIVFAKETTLDSERGYNFDFMLSENGVYTIFIGSDEFGVSEAETITYINSEKNNAAISNLTSAAATVSDVKNMLADSDKRSELGLFGDFYKSSYAEDVASILLPSVKGKTLTYEEITELIDKAYAVVKIGKSSMTAEDKNYLHMSDTLSDYFRDDFWDSASKIIKFANVSTIEEFDNALRDSIIVCTLNVSDGTGDSKNILKDFSSDYNLTSSAITDDLITYLSKKTPFENMEDVLYEISNYKKSVQRPTGGGGLTSSSGGGGGYLTGAEVPVYEKEETATAEIFDDLKDAEWAREEITELYYKGIVNGVTDSEFKPNDSVKREEFAKLLTTAFKIDLVSTEQHFDDVRPGEWYYDYVNSLYLAGGTTGVGDRLFGVGENISRQDICVMIYRMVNIAGGKFKTEGATAFENIVDNTDIADYAKEAVEELCSAGIISGYEDGTFNPYGIATRAEAAKIICRVLNDVKY